MRRVCALLLLLCGVSSCGLFGGGLGSPLNINGRWVVDSELGGLRSTCITIENYAVARTGDCDESPGTTTFAYHPVASISSSDEVVISYSVGGAPADPLVLFDLHRHADGTLRGVMIIYTNGVATTSSTYTNVFWTKQ